MEIKKGDEQFTPAYIFEALGLEFDLDPAHPPFKTSVPCRSYYTKKDDGLTKNWYGNVWLNPPFSNAEKWVNKFIEHNKGIALLPVSNSKWFTALWNMEDLAICMLPSTIKFDLQNGLKNHIFIRVCLIALGEENKQSLLEANINKLR